MRLRRWWPRLQLEQCQAQCNSLTLKDRCAMSWGPWRYSKAKLAGRRPFMVTPIIGSQRNSGIGRYLDSYTYCSGPSEWMEDRFTSYLKGRKPGMAGWYLLIADFTQYPGPVDRPWDLMSQYSWLQKVDKMINWLTCLLNITKQSSEADGGHHPMCRPSLPGMAPVTRPTKLFIGGYSFTTRSDELHQAF